MKKTVLSVSAQKLLQSHLNLMPTNNQKDNLKALWFLFLPAQGRRLPSQSQTKSPSALSRFLNRYSWSQRGLIREPRQANEAISPDIDRKKEALTGHY